ncbi:MAG: arylsulfatase [Planctomycetota bacterium]
MNTPAADGLPAKPNIVVILADDWGYGDVSCLNPESKIPTPYTDRIATEGMTFTDAHSNSAVCTPTRYGLLTGRYCFRSRLKQGVLGGYDRLLIEEGRDTLATVCGRAGYRTAVIGKWHLGMDWAFDRCPEPNAEGKLPWDGSLFEIDYGRGVSAGPQTVGFDQSCVLPASLDIPPYCCVEDGWVRDRPDRRVADSPRPAFWRAGEIAEGMEHETCLLDFTRRAEQYIADRAGGEDPFMLYLPLPSPHTPHVPRPPFRGKSGCGAYGDYVVEHDWSIGRVIEAIRGAGIEGETLVIVTSDNGAHMRGHGQETFDFEREFGHRSNHVYRGQKSDCWDGGHRVPTFAWWPGVVEAGSVCGAMVCLTDVFATVCELVGEAVREGAGEDSVSLVPALRGEAGFDRGAVVHHGVSGEFAIRRGRWKLVACQGSGGWSQSAENAPAEQGAVQLYDLEADAGEMADVAAAEPGLVRELLGELAGIAGADAPGVCTSGA